MDSEANKKSKQVVPQPQPQPHSQSQIQTSTNQGYLPDPNTPSSTPFVPQPQGTVRTSAEIGTIPKTTVTPAAWRDTAGNETANTTQSDEIPLDEQGYAGMQNMEDISFHDILHETTQPVPDGTASAPPYIMMAMEQNFAND